MCSIVNCAFFLANHQKDVQARRLVSLHDWGYAPPEVASPGPASGIVLRAQRVIDNKLQNPVGPVSIPAM